VKSFIFSVGVRGTWGAEQAITSRLVSQNLFSSSLRGGPRAGICSVYGSSLGILCFVVCIIISLIIWFCMSVYIYGVRGGMHDTELLGEKRLFGA